MLVQRKRDLLFLIGDLLFSVTCLLFPLFLGLFIELIWNILDDLFSLQKAIREAFSMQISFLLEDSVLNGLFLEGEASEYKTYGSSHACD